jgi:hypothetical protein
MCARWSAAASCAAPRRAPRRLAEIRAYLEQISAQWDEALARLRRLVEAGGS